MLSLIIFYFWKIRLCEEDRGGGGVWYIDLDA